MALDFGAGDYVDCGSAGSLDNLTAFTFCCWGKVPDNATDRNIFQKSHFNTTGWRDGEITVNDRLFAGINRATSACQARADLTNFSTWPGFGEWVFMAGRVNTAGAAGDQQLWMGSLTAPPVEPSSYTNQTAGSGSVPADGTLNFFVGNRNPVSQDRPFGMMAFYGHWNRLLTAAEINHQWARPQRTTGNVLFLHLGFGWGTGTQRDLSGNGNHGTVTGASIADHIPLPGLRVGRHRAQVTPLPVRTQEGFRFRADDGSESGASWLAAQDADINRSPDTVTRLRLLTDVAGDAPSEAFTKQYRRVPGGQATGTGPWMDTPVAGF